MAEVLTRNVRVGLIGSGIGESRSPALHMREGAENGLDYHYELIDLAGMEATVDDLPRLVADAEKRGFRGLNVTHPCKQAVIPLLDGLSPDAETLAAVNTIVFRDGRRLGYNTDWSGFAESFERGLPDVPRDTVLVLGAGGAGAAVSYAALKLGTRRLLVYDPIQARSRGLAASMGRAFPDRRVEPAGDVSGAMMIADGLIHATPTGMARHPGLPISADLIEERHWIAEIVYFPLDTELLTVARARGCRTLDGGGMAVFQAAGAFECFTGIRPDRERMLSHFEAMTRGA